MSRRHEFTKATKRATNKRANGRCEAMGAVYGLMAGERCAAILTQRTTEYDHYPMSALDEGSGLLENCVACCKSCHAFKTARYDIPMQAKGKRIRRANGPEELRRRTKSIPSRPMQSRPFPKRTA